MGDHSNGNGSAPRRDRHIAVIGAGPGGISSGYYLRQHGYESFTIFERADDVGGTWQRNRYPGLACDVWSHVYCFTFALNPSWTRSYAAQPEILAYMRKTVTDLGLWDKIRLDTGIDDELAPLLDVPLHVRPAAADDLADVSPDPALLHHLADPTGGAVIPIADAGRLAAAATRGRPDRPTTVEYSLWDSPYLFLFVTSCLTAEWALRKRLGLA